MCILIFIYKPGLLDFFDRFWIFELPGGLQHMSAAEPGGPGGSSCYVEGSLPMEAYLGPVLRIPIGIVFASDRPR